MKVWAVCVVVFFGAAEFYQWLQHVTLPFPVYAVAGLLLAIVSNGEQWQRLQSQWLPARRSTELSPAKSGTLSLDTASPANTDPNPSLTSIPASSAPTPTPLTPRSYPGPQLPNLTPPSSKPSVSFTIRKSE
jgi:hypothetical protein